MSPGSNRVMLPAAAADNRSMRHPPARQSSRRARAALALLAVLVVLASGCATMGGGGRRAPQLTARPPVQTGVASFYGREQQGRRTASGERFDMKALTA